MTCPNCGARNTAEAPWCTQCLEPLTPAGSATPAAGSDDPPPAGTPDDAPLWGTPSASPTPPPRTSGSTGGAARDRAIRSVDGRVEWRCAACDSWNDLEVPICAVCGQRLGASVTGAGTASITERVGRARRLLWVAAGIGGVLMVVSIVLLVAAMRSGAG